MKRRKPDPLKCLPNTKQRGEWVEIKFMAEAAGRGLTVLKPHGDSARFDCVVTSGGPLYRVQVKSAFSMSDYAYRGTTIGSKQRSRFSSKEIDFLAAYVFPCDAWYIIPARAVHGKMDFAVFPHRRNSRGRYEKYREAWHLLPQSRTGKDKPTASERAGRKGNRKVLRLAPRPRQEQARRRSVRRARSG